MAGRLPGRDGESEVGKWWIVVLLVSQLCFQTHDLEASMWN